MVSGNTSNNVGLTNLLATLLSSVVHDDWRVDEGAGSGHILSQQAFHFMWTQADRQIEQLHWPILGIIKENTITWDRLIFHKHLRSRSTMKCHSSSHPDFKILLTFFSWCSFVGLFNKSAVCEPGDKMVIEYSTFSDEYQWLLQHNVRDL